MTARHRRAIRACLTHELGEPADGSLIVATRYGSFRLPAGDGDAERIGDSYQDTMGFTVAGPDHF